MYKIICNTKYHWGHCPAHPLHTLIRKSENLHWIVFNCMPWYKIFLWGNVWDHYNKFFTLFWNRARTRSSLSNEAQLTEIILNSLGDVKRQHSRSRVETYPIQDTPGPWWFAEMMASHKSYSYCASLVKTGSSYLKALLTKSQMPAM